MTLEPVLMLTLQVGVPALLSLLLSLACEPLVQPRPAPFRQRSRATLSIHVGTWLVLYALALLVLQRGWLSAGLLNVLYLVVIQSCRSKWDSLKEPFLVQDFEYFLDAIRHPRLYVPFFGLGLAIAASTSGAAAFLAFLWWEPSLITTHGAMVWLLCVASIGGSGALLLGTGLTRLPSVTLDPQTDLHRHGMISYFWAYGLYPTEPLDPSLVPDCLREPHRTASPGSPSSESLSKESLSKESLPNMVIVQSEAFFDPREWQPDLPRDLLPNWDRMRMQALASGPLRVPVWGANTVRSEAAFLTGIDNAALGMHRFMPYRPMASQAIPNLVSALKQIGYRCVALHPYPASFYDRERVMPMLGFDEFIDISSFDVAERDGQYISDKAVARKVHELLAQGSGVQETGPRETGPKETGPQENEQPLMVFVITMENHGPLHLEPASSEWRNRIPHHIETRLQQRDADTLSVYLRHLHNADSMLGELRDSLIEQPRHGLLCWYGDHVPIMEAVYESLGEPSGDTHYLVWSTRDACQPTTMTTAPTKIECLAQRLWQDLAQRQTLRDQAESHQTESERTAPRAAHGTQQQGFELQEQQ
ncbi:capsular polysaccharide biosynthesis protein [Halomonas cupida]|uniref:Capsular polysaccharide biosynthesis protein n=1 Tax=Halomonas cupida TaxID=44933 RepID=A0A1M7IVK8_9GAMM|nr:LTA synthase family protein [Halomonas cupida]GEN24208.1 capsular polysaccharide biosynthesis protein [Halomonas cupida]SHM44824.1 Phosphoglycerol transferase MdoB [Halomonas cupida]